MGAVGAAGLPGPPFANQLPGALAQETATMESLGVSPMSPGSPGFSSMAELGHGQVKLDSFRQWRTHDNSCHGRHHPCRHRRRGGRFRRRHCAGRIGRGPDDDLRYYGSKRSLHERCQCRAERVRDTGRSGRFRGLLRFREYKRSWSRVYSARCHPEDEYMSQPMFDVGANMLTNSFMRSHQSALMSACKGALHAD
jgi:hypothetical protein